MSAFVEVLPPELTGPDHPEWFEARRRGVTASEIAAILGLSPYESPFSLYWRKKGLLDEQPDTDAMRWGRRLESYIAEEFTERHEYEFTPGPAGLYAHADRPWRMASPDRLIYQWIDPYAGTVEPIAGVECKTTGSWDGWGEEGTGEVPVHIRCQTIWQADVLGVPCVYVPVVNGRTYREYIVEHDPDDAKFMREAALAFMDRLARNDPPDVDDAPATIGALKRLHPDVDDVEARVPDGLAQQYRRACRSLNKAKDRKRLLEAQLRQRMGRARHALDPAGDRVATRIVVDIKPYQVGPVHKDYLNPSRETP